MESAFREVARPGFELIETMLWQPVLGLRRRALHLARLERTARAFGITPRGIEAALGTVNSTHPLRVRLSVDHDGRAQVRTARFSPLPDGVIWWVHVSEKRLDSADPFLRHKTSQRALYDQTRAALPDKVDEVLFANERGEMCEGTITNLFADFGDGLVTPPVSAGLLPGILRQEMLAAGAAREATVPLAALPRARRLYVGNSLRGLIPARLMRAERMAPPDA